MKQNRGNLKVMDTLLTQILTPAPESGANWQLSTVSLF